MEAEPAMEAELPMEAEQPMEAELPMEAKPTEDAQPSSSVSSGVGGMSVGTEARKAVAKVRASAVAKAKAKATKAKAKKSKAKALAPVRCQINIREPDATPIAEPVAVPIAEPVAVPIAEPVTTPTAKPPVPSKGRTGGDAATSSGTRSSPRLAGRKRPAKQSPYPIEQLPRPADALIPPMVIRRSTVTIPAVPLEPPAN